MKARMSLAILLTLQLIFIVSCNFEKSDWEESKSQNTIPAFENFITEYPQSAKIDSANYFIQKINLDSIIAVNTIAAYEDFRTQYPNGYFESVVLNRINDLIPEEPVITKVNIHSTVGLACKVPFDMDVLHKIGSISREKIPFINAGVQCGMDGGMFLTLGDSLIQVQPYRSNIFVNYSYIEYATCKGTCTLKVHLKDKEGHKSNEFLSIVDFED